MKVFGAANHTRESYPESYPRIIPPNHTSSQTFPSGHGLNGNSHMPVGKVLQSTTTYYSSTTPILFCTTTCYSSTTPYCKVLLQYYPVLQSTTPVLLCFTKYYTTPLLQRTTPVLTLYYKIQLQYYSVLQSSTHDWNVIYDNARCNKSQPPTPPNTAPATKNESQDWSCSHLKRHLPCATQQKAASKILRLPRKMNFMIDPSHIWNVIYNARCNKCQPPTSPNTAPATQNESHDWSVSHMTFHLSIDPAHIWNVIYHARRNKRQLPPSQNTAPATQNESHDWSVSYMKRHLRQCVVQQESASNSTKYCACHEKWVSGLILLTFETPFTMRGATALTFQPHQIMRLPRKMTRMIDLAHIWNVIYNARSNTTHPPTSPNIAPATQNGIPKYEEYLLKTVEASFTMRGRPRSEHEIAKLNPPFRGAYFSPSATHLILYWKLQHFALWLPIQISPNIAPATKSRSPRSPNVVPATNSDTPTSPNIVPATEKWHSNITKCCACHEKWHCKRHQILWLPRRVTELLLSWIVTVLNCCFTELLLYWAVTLLSCYFTVILLSCYFTELLFYGAVTLLNCYFRKAVTLLHCDSTELLLDWTVTELLLYWAVTLLSCYITELLLYWTVTWLNCFFTELLRYWAVTWLNCYWALALHWLTCYFIVTLLSCYSTELFLYWAATLLSCYFTVILLTCYFTGLLLYWTIILVKPLLYRAVTLLFFYGAATLLLLYWAVTLLNCYFSKAVTLLNCYFTELLHNWTVTWLSCYFTELFLYWAAILLSCYFTD